MKAATGAERDEAFEILRVVIISEHGLARAGIAAAVRCHADMEVVGEYDTCKAALAAIMKSPPHAAVMELAPGGGDILDAITRCHTAFPNLAHIVITQTKDGDLAERAIKAGAKAFIYKGVGPTSLAAAIRDAVRGELHICRCIASPMLHKTIYGNGKHKTKHPDLAKLSDREFQVFQLLGAGWDNHKIAEALGISVKTLNVHKEHLKDRLGFTTTSGLKSAATEWQVRGDLATP
ncbi:MAG TPA: response regulator transcription factor [Kiritimatiellia bacterium]|nr:response regulator transcription factor [Kiritimatiellia bacterium]